MRNVIDNIRKISRRSVTLSTHFLSSFHIFSESAWKRNVVHFIRLLASFFFRSLFVWIVKRHTWVHHLLDISTGSCQLFRSRTLGPSITQFIYILCYDSSKWVDANNIKTRTHTKNADIQSKCTLVFLVFFSVSSSTSSWGIVEQILQYFHLLSHSNSIFIC